MMVYQYSYLSDTRYIMDMFKIHNLYSTFVRYPAKILYAFLIHLSTCLLHPVGNTLTKMAELYFHSRWMQKKS